MADRSRLAWQRLWMGLLDSESLRQRVSSRWFANTTGLMVAFGETDRSGIDQRSKSANAVFRQPPGVVCCGLLFDRLHALYDLVECRNVCRAATEPSVEIRHTHRRLAIDLPQFRGRCASSSVRPVVRRQVLPTG